jgi:hypothetical protein
MQIPRRVVCLGFIDTMQVKYDLTLPGLGYPHHDVATSKIVFRSGNFIEPR